MSLTCIKHKNYKGKESPSLSCRACCAIFIAAIKQNQSEDIQQFLERKQKEYKERWGK